MNTHNPWLLLVYYIIFSSPKQKELQAAEEIRVAKEAEEVRCKPPEPKPKSLVEIIYEENRVSYIEDDN